MSREKQWKLGWVMAKKQPQVVKIPPHMVHKLYCERYCATKKARLSPFTFLLPKAKKQDCNIENIGALALANPRP